MTSNATAVAEATLADLVRSQPSLPGSVLQDRLVSRDMKKLLILAVLVALGVVVAKRLRSV